MKNGKSVSCKCDKILIDHHLAPQKIQLTTQMNKSSRGRLKNGFRDLGETDQHHLVKTSRPLPLPARAPIGKHNLFTHFPKDLDCEICKRTKSYKGY